MTTKSSAKHSIIRGCLYRSKLALKSASRITSLDKLTYYDDKENTDDDSDDSHHLLTSNDTRKWESYSIQLDLPQN